MNHLGLFEGIGGFSLAARWMNWNTVAWCEINEFCQKVLKYHFPKAIPHGDIKTTDFTPYRGFVDIVTGGFPCQPYSATGRRKGKSDDRHLWPEMLRAVIEVQPTWIVGENVPGLLNWKRGMVLAEIYADLEAAGFEVFPPIVLPACGKNALHERGRLWIVAHSNRERNEGEFNKFSHNEKKMEKSTQTFFTYKIKDKHEDVLPKPLVVGSTNGLSVGLDGITFSKWREQSTSGYGNAIVPQIAFELFKAIEKTNNGLD